MFISEAALTGKTVVAKIKPGEDLFSSLKEIIKKHEINCGYIPVIQGCLKQCRLLTVDQLEGQTELTNNRFELNEVMVFNGSGTIARDENGDAFIHIHTTVTSQKDGVKMGHLLAATVCLTTEVVIVELNDIKMGRKEDPDADNETLLYIEKF
jgi:predicted DNA-binding protein with PD1-like motif